MQLESNTIKVFKWVSVMLLPNEIILFVFCLIVPGKEMYVLIYGEHVHFKWYKTFGDNLSNKTTRTHEAQIKADNIYCTT
jgi:hypothetical protein